jgi:uncharacterized protein
LSRFGVKQPEGTPKKPLPRMTRFSEGFWEGTRAQELRVQTCNRCGHRQFPPKAACEECASTDLGWTKTRGRGVVYAFTIIRQVIMNSLAFEAEIPYALAMVDLEEGVRVVAQIQGCPPEQVKAGMQVEVYFEDIGGVSIPKFRPSGGA